MHTPPMKLRRFLTALAVITASTQILRPPQHAGACVPRERDALLAFKRGISTDTAKLLASWRDDNGQEQSDCCWWSGVRCSNQTGRIVELNLRNHAGSFYPFQEGLIGNISSSLLWLARLRRLDLSWNALEGPTGGRIPEFLGSFKNLRYLNLSYMSFSGAVPAQLGNLSKLEHLDLSYYSIFGQGRNTGSSDASWVTHLRMLRYLDLGSVNLSATANWHRVMNMLPSLRYLSLSQCSLSSTNSLSLSQLNLTRLETLDLSHNSFDHSAIESCWFWNVTGLRDLNLRGTHLKGQIPEKLGRMASLQSLDLSSNNNLDVLASNLTYLCNLEILKLEQCLSDVNIVQLFEWLPHCASSKLKELHLQSNNITGCLPPSIKRFTSLKTLSLFDNKLTGSVPSEIGVLSNLTTLDLSNNRFQGVITEENFAKLNSLEWIDLSDNSLKIDVNHKWIPPFRLERAYFRSCHVGPLFPVWMQWQGNIKNVDISSAGINDKLPNWFCTTFSKALLVDVSNNEISGTLPKCMEIMSMEQLYLSSNKLTGHIPRLPRSLISLYIYNNSLSGPLPSNFGTPNIEFLVLFSNYITGQLPVSICDLQSLIILDIDNNLLTGELPNCNGMGSLMSLQLRNNSFSGQFPSFLQRCDLILLDLSQNKFSGRLPMWLCELMHLQFLRLSHNMFSGNIPTNISCLKYLQYFNLANNNISCSIPYHLSNLTAMTRKSPLGDKIFPLADDAAIMGDFLVNIKGQTLNYHDVTILEVVSLDLSSNALTGEIPPEIASLDAVLNLNLSWNHLVGEVPKMIGAMQSLESLDLSNNMLSGEIPSSLSMLTGLSYLDMSYNNLTGRIPQGSQLDTLYSENPSIYDGNSGLCGPPLHRNCSRNDTSRSHDQKSEEAGFYPVSFCFGLGLGFLLSHWVVFCVLLFKRSWRFAYFRLADKLYDLIYVFLVVSWRRIQMRYCR